MKMIEISIIEKEGLVTVLLNLK